MDAPAIMRSIHPAAAARQDIARARRRRAGTSGRSSEHAPVVPQPSVRPQEPRRCARNTRGPSPASSGCSDGVRADRRLVGRPGKGFDGMNRMDRMGYAAEADRFESCCSRACRPPSEFLFHVDNSEKRPRRFRCRLSSSGIDVFRVGCRSRFGPSQPGEPQRPEPT
jgi:hypothetical protein